MSGYDIIGDVHAQADGLKLLLRQLGYHGDHFTPPEGRRAIFVGDLIDRGVQHTQVIDIVRNMIERGHAEMVMGNHEFNAICYMKEGKNGPIRPHTPRNTGDMAQFFEEFPYKSDSHGDLIKWFETLPVYIEKPGLRVVHACWNQNAIDVCAPYLRKKDHSLKQSAYKAYDSEKPDGFFKSLEVLLKGPEHKLPRGVTFKDVSGHERHKVRLYWWAEKGAASQSLVEKEDMVAKLLTDNARKMILRARNHFNYAAKLPVFFGHYNIPSEPFLVSSKAACVNFKHRLVAYRWNDGDKGLSPDRLTYV